MHRTRIASISAVALSAITPVALAAFTVLSATSAGAVPAFAAQTGAPCAACHVGGFGPQLTIYGRDFKLHGYTARSGSTS
jgi:mono/diheme cytochrome c family protein